MRRFALWLSGADPVILKDCGPLANTERIRFAGLGALILVPAVLGGFAMSYAISTLTRNPVIYVLAGLVWGLIVLAIDRYLVSTLTKSALPGQRRFVPVLARLVFAVLVGIAVAHPMVLLWFNDSISQTIAENRRDAVQDRQVQADRDVAAVPPAASSAESLTEQRNRRVANLDCLRQLKSYEQSNVRKTLPCGISSGEPDCGPRCQDLQRQITSVEGEIKALDERIADAGAGDATAEDLRRDEIGDIRTRAEADIADINAEFSTDYLARVAALEQLSERSKQVLVVELFLILFFVFVDILPVTMKIATPAGEYEQVRDTRLEQAVAVQMARRAVIGETEQTLARASARAERLLGEMEVITKVPLDLLEARERHVASFEQRADLLRQRSAGIDEAVTESDILRVRDLDRQAFTRAVAKTNDFMTKP